MYLLGEEENRRFAIVGARLAYSDSVDFWKAGDRAILSSRQGLTFLGLLNYRFVWFS